MSYTYDLIGGYGAAKTILTQPHGTVGLLRYDGELRTAFFRTHDEDLATETGERVVSPCAYLAEHDTYHSINELVHDSDATFDRKHADVLAWQITTNGIQPLCRYDETLTSNEDGEDGNDKALAAAIAALPLGCGFILGDYASLTSDFILGFKDSKGIRNSGCGPSISAEDLSDSEDMRDIPDDPRVDARSFSLPAMSTAS